MRYLFILIAVAVVASPVPFPYRPNRAVLFVPLLAESIRFLLRRLRCWRTVNRFQVGGHTPSLFRKSIAHQMQPECSFRNACVVLLSRAYVSALWCSVFAAAGPAPLKRRSALPIEVRPTAAVESPMPTINHRSARYSRHESLIFAV